MRTETQIEKKIDQALEVKERPGSGDAHAYARGAREALGWVLEEDDDIPGIEDD